MQNATWLWTLTVLGALGTLRADDWPQWLGPRQEAVYREAGIVDRIPEGGLPIVWRTKIGLGYAGPAVADGRVFVTDFVKETGDVTNNPGTRDELTGTERVLCLDGKTGDVLWTHADERKYAISYPTGPRCTPAVDGDRVYTLGAMGDLLCLSVGNGEVVWSKSLPKEYDVEVPIWGFAGHPLVHGDRLYCLVGGPGSVVVAFDKRTGKELWRALSAPEPGYCPPYLIEQGGREQLVAYTPKSLNGLDPATGKVVWSVPIEPSYSMSIAVPRKAGNVLYACGIGNVSVAIELNAEGTEAKVLWRGTPKVGVAASNATPNLADDTIYGADVDSGSLIAASLADGERLWQSNEATGAERGTKHATVFAVQHQPPGRTDGHRFLLFNERGDLIIADLSPEKYAERGRFHVLEPTTDIFRRKVVWSHPAFAMQSMFARNDEEIVRVNLAAE